MVRFTEAKAMQLSKYLQVGRSMLRNTGLLKFTRDGDDTRQWKQIPQQDEEESWHLQTWEEEDEEDENEHNTHQ